MSCILNSVTMLQNSSIRKGILLAVLVQPLLWGGIVKAEEQITSSENSTDTTENTLQMDTFTISADASSRGLSEAYSGGQVARGARMGILGNQDMMV